LSLTIPTSTHHQVRQTEDSRELRATEVWWHKKTCPAHLTRDTVADSHIPKCQPTCPSHRTVARIMAMLLHCCAELPVRLRKRDPALV
jgi:hypothetical protein